MLERLKWYLVEVILPKYVPVGVLAAVSYAVAFLLSHASWFEKYGITTGTWPLKMEAPSGIVTLIEWDTLKVTGGAAIAALVAVAIVAIQHHTTGAPTVPGGKRETDPPKGA